MTGNRRLRRGIYLLPTLFTIGNLFCGFSSVVQASMEAFTEAALLVIVAAVLDGLDGRIARLTRSTSDFGFEFDSLADLVSFGIAPAFLVFRWALTPLQRVGWLIAFLYVVCAAMRLARFNIRRKALDKRYFLGLPAPMAACAAASLVWVFPTLPEAPWVSGLLAVAVVGVATLMISRFRYRSFKDIDLRNRRSYLWVFPLAGVLVAVATWPEVTVLGLSAGYLVSGPAGFVWGLTSRGREEAPFGESGREMVDQGGRP